MQRDQFRASDEDREKVAAILQDAHAEGRLSRDEFDERLESTYAARTYQDLNGLLADLPAGRAELAKPGGGALTPKRPPGQVRSKARRAARKTLNTFWWIYVMAVAINIVVWIGVATLPGDAPIFWPIFVAGPWGAVLGVSELAYRSGERREE